MTEYLKFRIIISDNFVVSRFWKLGAIFKRTTRSRVWVVAGPIIDMQIPPGVPLS